MIIKIIKQFYFSSIQASSVNFNSGKGFQRISTLCKCLIVMICCCVSLTVKADLILSAPPRELPEAGLKLYGPLASHLSELLGEKVIYQHPNNWLEYQRDLRRGVYDIVFDGPHFVSW
ncbi:MAG: hypothetical protein AMJ53_07800, partial [Gammaproteobacteria bacterium SG8_11]